MLEIKKHRNKEENAFGLISKLDTDEERIDELEDKQELPNLKHKENKEFKTHTHAHTHK